MRLLRAVPLGLGILLLLAASLGFGPQARAELTDQSILIPLIDVDLPGWQKKRGFPNIEQGQENGSPYIEAQIIYQKGGATITAVIREGGKVSKDLQQMDALREVQTPGGYRKRIAVQGVSGVELYDKSQKKGVLALNVSNRFGISIEGKPLESTEPLKELANRLALAKLWRLAK